MSRLTPLCQRLWARLRPAAARPGPPPRFRPGVERLEGLVLPSATPAALLGPRPTFVAEAAARLTTLPTTVNPLLARLDGTYKVTYSGTGHVGNTTYTLRGGSFAFRIQNGKVSPASTGTTGGGRIALTGPSTLVIHYPDAHHHDIALRFTGAVGFSHGKPLVKGTWSGMYLGVHYTGTWQAGRIALPSHG